MIKHFFIIIIFLNCHFTYSQNYELSKELDTVYYKNKTDILDNEFGLNKVFIKEYKLQCLIALSRYPVLKSTAITFKYRKLKSSLACRPKIGFLFRKKSKRKYYIFINNKSKKLEGILLKDVPFKAQVGVIAHEIAHVVDYSKKRNSKVLKTAFNYLSINKREKIEKSVDSIAIAHGFGWQLYNWADYIINKSNVSEKYKNYKRRVYLEPEEILNIIK